MKWLKARLKERSTRRGALLLTAVLAVYFGPDQADLIIGAIATLCGAFQFIKSERKEPLL